MKIAFLGDIGLFGKFDLVYNELLYDYFAAVKEHLANFDYVVANLESPIVANGTKHGFKSAHIKSNPRNIDILTYLGIDAVNLANNHIFDYGTHGYKSTINILDKNDISYFGVENVQLEVYNNNVAVAFHGYCSYNTNPLGIARGGGVGINPLNVHVIEERLRRNHERGLFNIISIHSGQEHINCPSRDDIRMARYFAEVCPYVYYGHHPHVLQGVECQGDSLIAYSLGNFCFDDVYTSKSKLPLVRQTQNNREGMILELELNGEGVGDYRLTPLVAKANELVVGAEDVVDKVIEYSAVLGEEDPSYSARRDRLIAQYIRDRKSTRTLSWYLKRLNYKTIGIIGLSVCNIIRYNISVRNILADVQ